MKKLHWKRLLAIAALTTLVNACKSAKDYAQFGRTGQAYAQAINKLIDATEINRLNSTINQINDELSFIATLGRVVRIIGQIISVFPVV